MICYGIVWDMKLGKILVFPQQKYVYRTDCSFDKIICLLFKSYNCWIYPRSGDILTNIAVTLFINKCRLNY